MFHSRSEENRSAADVTPQGGRKMTSVRLDPEVQKRLQEARERRESRSVEDVKRIIRDERRIEQRRSGWRSILRRASSAH
ncbi:hypothetical protein F8O01_01170 [Pseudoclavibacter chungangensis]|uniref:Uncharacterized protein n=1 Tax=Pseudoclavibacter chungangensis TaxID=587635 RepID=A0A7J5C1W9_9MICO|nr:hypothetical protein F8O01_01170 [Pseudoclavibacter chungangensis]